MAVLVDTQLVCAHRQLVRERQLRRRASAYGSYAVGRKPVTLTLCGSALDPYNAVLLLLAVLGRLEHPTIPKDALAVIQRIADRYFVDSFMLVVLLVLYGCIAV